MNVSASARMELFRSFDSAPLATASMAQVHRAVLHDGSPAVVKVQRPGVRQRIEIDIEVLHEVARFLTKYTALGARYGIAQMVRELEHSLSQELDFRQEGENTRTIGRQIAGFLRLTTPTVYSEYTARRVLTLSFVRGRHLSEIPRGELTALDAPAIAKDLLSAYLKQIVIDGIFHCDPHPGNILLTDEGQIALLDFGMVGRFDAGQKDNVILLLLALPRYERRAHGARDRAARPDQAGVCASRAGAQHDDAARQGDAQPGRHGAGPVAGARSGPADPRLHA